MTAEAKQRREAAEAERKAETEKRNAKKLEAIALAEGAAAQRRSEFQKRKEARKLKDKERKKIPKPELKRMRAEESKQRRADAEAKMRAARVAKEERELKVQAGIPEDRTVSQEFIKRAERRARLKEQSKQRRVEAESRLKAEKEAKIQRQLPVISEENILDPAEPVEDGQSNGAEESLKDESTVAGGGPATEKKPINADVRANDDAWNSW